MYMYKVFPSNCQKLKKKGNKCEISSARCRHIDVWQMTSCKINKWVKFMSFNKSVKLKFHALLAKTNKNLQICCKTSALLVNPCSGPPKNNTILFSNSN